MTRLKELRTRYGMQQKDIAERLGTTQQTIARWETGHTPIPAGHLKDLAVLLGCSVDHLLGVERPAHEGSRREFAEVDHGLPFGTARFVFSFGERDYPIDQGVREQLETRTTEFVGMNETKGWLEFATLNNKLVLVNPDAVHQFALITDEHEEMPNYFHPEVYHALENEDVEIGPATEQQVAELRSKLGTQGVLDLVVKSEVVYRDGSSARMFLDDDEGTTSVFSMAGHRSEVPKNAFMVLSSAGSDVKTFVNMSNVALLEVPLERYRRQLAEN